MSQLLYLGPRFYDKKRELFVIFFYPNFYISLNENCNLNQYFETAFPPFVSEEYMFQT